MGDLKGNLRGLAQYTGFVGLFGFLFQGQQFEHTPRISNVVMRTLSLSALPGSLI